MQGRPGRRGLRRGGGVAAQRVELALVARRLGISQTAFSWHAPLEPWHGRGPADLAERCSVVAHAAAALHERQAPRALGAHVRVGQTFHAAGLRTLHTAANAIWRVTSAAGQEVRGPRASGRLKVPQQNGASYVCRFCPCTPLCPPTRSSLTGSPGSLSCCRTSSPRRISRRTSGTG